MKEASKFSDFVQITFTIEEIEQKQKIRKPTYYTQFTGFLLILKHLFFTALLKEPFIFSKKSSILYVSEVKNCGSQSPVMV